MYNASFVVGYSVFVEAKNNFYYKRRYSISCVVNFYNAGVVTRDRGIGSRLTPLLKPKTFSNTRDVTDFF
jgi:hypothetical protein